MQIPRVTTGSPDLSGAFAWTACHAGEPGQSPGCAAWTKWRVAGCRMVLFWFPHGFVVSLLSGCLVLGQKIAAQMHDTPIRLMPTLLADARGHGSVW